jgi:hypothetical protein
VDATISFATTAAPSPAAPAARPRSAYDSPEQGGFESALSDAQATRDDDARCPDRDDDTAAPRSRPANDTRRAPGPDRQAIARRQAAQKAAKTASEDAQPTEAEDEPADAAGAERPHANVNHAAEGRRAAPAEPEATHAASSSAHAGISEAGQPSPAAPPACEPVQVTLDPAATVVPATRELPAGADATGRPAAVADAAGNRPIAAAAAPLVPGLPQAPSAEQAPVETLPAPAAEGGPNVATRTDDLAPTPAADVRKGDDERPEAAPLPSAARGYARAVKNLAGDEWTPPVIQPVAPSPVGSPGESEAEGVPNADAKTPATPQMSARAVSVLRALGVPAAVKFTDQALDGVQSVPGAVDAAAAEAVLAAAGAAADPGGRGFDGETGRRAYAQALKSDLSAPASMTFAEPVAAAPTTSEPAVQAAPRAEPAAPPETPITTQVVKAVSLAWKDGVGEAKIRLTPEHLGEVVVSLKVERGQVVAHVNAETDGVRAWIESHQQELRDGLSGQGLQLDRLVVTADGRRQQQPREDTPNRQRQAGPGTPVRQDAPRFEINV